MAVTGNSHLSHLLVVSDVSDLSNAVTHVSQAELQNAHILQIIARTTDIALLHLYYNGRHSCTLVVKDLSFLIHKLKVYLTMDSIWFNQFCLEGLLLQRCGTGMDFHPTCTVDFNSDRQQPQSNPSRQARQQFACYSGADEIAPSFSEPFRTMAMGKPEPVAQCPLVGCCFC